MNLRTALFFLGLATSLIMFAVIKRTPAQDVAASQAPSQSANIPVVVELFTSEGCSSCPPADQLLAKLETEQPIKNVEIIALEEHVDYWNDGGWMDPFSSDSATIRQYAYASAIGNGNAYTPQMVVDGQSEFVGSRERQARGAIEQAAGRKKIEVNVTAGPHEADGTNTFHIAISPLAGSPGGDAPEVWLAITEAKLHSDVRGGENSGQDLHHAPVLRKLKKIDGAKITGEKSFSSEERVKFDRGWKRENMRVVVFMQEKKSKKILGAGSTKLPS